MTDTEGKARVPRRKKKKDDEVVTSAEIVEESRHRADVMLRYSDGETARVSKDSAEYKVLMAERILAQRMLARRRLIPFIQTFNPNYEVGWCHEVLAAKLEKFVEDCANKRSPRLMITFPPRHGKQLADSTPVLTTTGWKTHGELQAGDYVFHPSGRPVEVLAVSDKTPSDWVVELSNGESIRCHERHEWTIYDRPRRMTRTVETGWFRREVAPGTQAVVTSGGRCSYQLPPVAALEYPEAELLMHPYVLGAWLGDGSRGKGCVSLAPADIAVAEQIEQLGYERSASCVHKDTGVVTTYFSGPRPGVLGRMLSELRQLGVTPRKYIPESYLRSSVQQRLELLAGLVDTDGHCDGNGRMRFTTADYDLACGVLDLCTTLGFRPYISTVQPSLSSSGIQGRVPYYVVGWQPTMDIPCVLERKRPQRLAPQRAVGVIDVRYEPNGEVGHCITVDSSDGLYLAGYKLIPTHNSEQTSRKLPAYILGHYPWMEIILASYGISLAEQFSKHVLQIMKDERYQQLFPKSLLNPDDQAMSGWRTTEGGGFKPAGVGVGVTGMGAHALIIDDPFKDRAEANSDTIRESTWDWYTDVALTRLAPGGGVLIINTRWHDDDLSGRLLSMAADPESSEYIDQWDLVNFAAIADEDEYLTLDNRLVTEPEEGARLVRHAGEALHPARYDLSLLLRIKATMTPQSWNALFQQKPVPDDGEYFTRDQIAEYDPADGREDGTAYIACDFAITEKQSADWTVIVVGIHMPNDTVHVDDVIRFRSGDAFKIIDTLLNMFTKYKRLNPILGVEDGQIWRAMSALFFAEARRRGLYPSIELLKPLSDKEARARPLQGRMQMHMVTFQRHAPWLEKLTEELLRFPSGVHDDIVDALAWMMQLVVTKTPPKPLLARRRASPTGWQNKKTVQERILEHARGTGSAHNFMAS